MEGHGKTELKRKLKCLIKSGAGMVTGQETQL